MKKNIILKSIFTAFLFVLSFSVSLILKPEPIFAQGAFTCFMGEINVWEARGIEGCSSGFTTDVESCQGNCEAVSSGNCTAEYGYELPIQCVPVTEECTPGSISNDLNNRCVCSAPQIIMGERESSSDTINLYCVSPCLDGATQYDNSSDVSPSCSCLSSNNMTQTESGTCISNITIDTDEPTDEPAGGGGGGGSTDESGVINSGGGNPITAGDFDDLNPLKQAARTAGTGNISETLTTPGAIISRLLEFSFPLAGLILFIMLFWGGFEITYGASTSKSMEAGKNRITAALIGFFLLFSSYWIIQILEVVLGIKVFL